MRVQECKELAIRARCLGGKFAAKTAAYTSQPFDNTAVAGGFVAWAAEWARKVGERHQIELALTDAASVPEDACLELELCRVSGDARKANVAAGEGASERQGLAPCACMHARLPPHALLPRGPDSPFALPCPGTCGMRSSSGVFLRVLDTVNCLLLRRRRRLSRSSVAAARDRLGSWRLASASQ